MSVSRSAGAPNHAVRQQIAAGFDLLRQGKVAEAVRLGDGLIAEHPRDPEALYLASEAQLLAGEIEIALRHVSAAADAAPGQLPLLLKKANHLILLRRRSDARDVASSAVSIAAGDGHALWAIGRIYSKCDDPIAARALFHRARDAGLDSPGLRYDLAAAEFFIGDVAAAEANLEALLAMAPGNGPALYLRSTLRRQTDENNHVGDLQSRLQEGFPDTAARAACLHALAKELEDLGRDAESFTALVEGAGLKRRTLNYDAAAERESIDAIRAAYDAQAMATPSAGHDEEGAIFIVGMPRTGTTLVERMLGRHREVKSAGELQDFGQALAAAVRKARERDPAMSPVEASLSIDFAALGREYMAGARQAVPGAQLFVDKMPVNFMYCGLIRKALPRARLIHLVRDPMDSCYAVFKTLFTQAYHFSYDLEELAAYYATYHRLMQHWHAVMPGQILDVRYEDLVTGPEEQARRILAWCGLDWQADVLVPTPDDAPSTTASAAQVREPVHAGSVQKWRRHEAGLATVQAHLQAAGIVQN
jgi:tetratricopeptide (TPR) repeat protein